MDKRVEIIKAGISAEMDKMGELKETVVREMIDDMAFSICYENNEGAKNATRLAKKACDEILGLGPVQSLFEQKDISEIMINGQDVFYEKDGEIRKSGISLDGPGESLRIIRTICRKSGRTVNAAEPITDACLDDGTRVNMVLSPVSVNGHSVTIRKFPDKPMESGELVENGFINLEAMKFLKEAYVSRRNIFICGGAGTGKTTLLNVLANFTGPGERVVTIEDSAELRLDGVVNLVRLETRTKNSEGKGGIGIRELIRASLRMRPDRIIVGEVRGEEALDMLQAMNTGHEGSISTGHANSPKELISRLETMVLTGKDMPLKAVRKQIANAIDIIVCVAKPGGRRRVVQICELNPEDGDGIDMRTIYRYERKKDKLTRIYIKKGRKS